MLRVKALEHPDVHDADAEETHGAQGGAMPRGRTTAPFWKRKRYWHLHLQMWMQCLDCWDARFMPCLSCAHDCRSCSPWPGRMSPCWARCLQRIKYVETSLAAVWQCLASNEYWSTGGIHVMLTGPIKNNGVKIRISVQLWISPWYPIISFISVYNWC